MLFILIFFFASAILASLVSKDYPSTGLSCVNIYFDQGSLVISKGRGYAQALKNLISKFYFHDIQVSAVEFYQAGDLERCNASFYIGSEVDIKIPKKFLEDYVRTNKKVTWIGYNIWQLGRGLERELGVRYLGLNSRMQNRERNKALHFKDILYKGQVYSKAGPISADSFSGEEHTSLVELLPMDVSKFRFLAEIQNSRTRELIPYAIQAGSRFYFVENLLAQTRGQVQAQDLDPDVFFQEILQEILVGPSSSHPKYGIR